jgi:hypothetical protein
MKKEFVLYRWDRAIGAPHYLVVEADTWERRKRLAMNRGEEPTRFELARGEFKLMGKLQSLAMGEED